MMTTAKLSVLLVLWVLIFMPVFPGLVNAWISNSNNSHGVLVPFVALYLIWQKRTGFSSSVLSTSWWGTALLVISLLLFIISYASGISVTMRIAMVTSVIGLTQLMVGKEIYQKIAFPLWFLLFMVPLPDSIVSTVSFPLQMMATSASASIIQLFSIPVYQEGNMLFFVQTQLEVAEACSGIRSLLSLTMLSVLFAYMLNQSRGMKVMLVMSGIPIAIGVNIARVSATGVLAHNYGGKVARGFLHDFSGVAVFLTGAVLLFGVYLLLSKTFNAESTPLINQRDKGANE